MSDKRENVGRAETTKVGRSPEKIRIPELDGIRGLAILLVIVWHFLVGPGADSALPAFRLIARLGIQTWSGVDLFFVLSGFLIGGILVDAKEADNYFQVFYIRRVFRILPIYAVMCVSYPLAVWISPKLQTILDGTMPWYVYASFTQNFWLAHHQWNSYLNATWSLAVEEQFYLTLPALVWLTPRRHLWKLIAGLCIATPLLRSTLYLHYYPNWRAAAYTLMTSRADALMLGVSGALIVRSERARDWLGRRKRPLMLASLGLGGGFAALTLRGSSMMSTAMSTFGYTWVALFYLSVLLIAITWQGGFLSRLFRTRCLMWMGTIAYGLYLLHGPLQPVAYALFGYSRPQLSAWFDIIPMACGIALSLFLAHISWIYFERPLVGVGHTFAYLKNSPLPLACAARSSIAVPEAAPVVASGRTVHAAATLLAECHEESEPASLPRWGGEGTLEAQ